MGDNRDNSFDSRHFGFVDRQRIVSRATTVMLSMNPEDHYLPCWSRFSPHSPDPGRGKPDQFLMSTRKCAGRNLLSRPAGTLSSTPSGGEGWGEEATGKWAQSPNSSTPNLSGVWKLPVRTGLQARKALFAVSWR